MKTALNGVTLLECMQLIRNIFRNIFFVVCCFAFFSCSQISGIINFETDEVVLKKDFETPPPEKEEPPAFSNMENPSEPALKERLWTILVYMCADNDLEASAMEDLCEMEFSDLNTDSVTVIALVDRSPSYDTSYDNWYGSRLYKLKTGRESDSKFLISQEIECRDLGLEVGKEIELDMSSSYVLSSSLMYARKKFPANNYGLIIWGHGTGWRSSETETETACDVSAPSGIFKGFSYDGSSGTYMTLYQTGEGIRSGLNGMKLDFLGFDTCYGAELEVLYELKDHAKLCVGSEGLISSSGWNYQELFSSFEKSGKTASDLCSSVLNQFKNQYAYKTGASIVCVDMEQVSPFFEVCNTFWDYSAQKIDCRKVRDDVMGLLYSSSACKVKRYSYGAGGSDVYLDVSSMMSALTSYFSVSEISERYAAFEAVRDSCIKESWASDGMNGGIGVYFSTLNDSANLCSSHPAAYKKGACADQISFVNECSGYVPCENDGKSFLTKLFYTQFL